MKKERISRSGRATFFCPFHKEKTPSLYCWPDGGFFCHGCHARGWLKNHPQLERRYQEMLFKDVRSNPNQLWLPFVVEQAQISMASPS